MKSALLIIDMQNRWLSKDNLIPDKTIVIQNILKLKKFFKKNNLPIINIRRVHPRSDHKVSLLSMPSWNLEGSEEAQVILELTPDSNEIQISKTKLSAFFKTHLYEILKDLSVDHLVITGYQARACILATSIDADQYEFEQTVVGDAILDTEVEYFNFYHKVFADAEFLKSTKDVLQMTV